MHTLTSTWQSLPEIWLTATLVMARLLGLVVVLPGPGGRNLSIAFRGVLCGALTVLVVPTCRAAPAVSPEPFAWLWTVAQEASLGLLLGTGVYLLFWGIQVAGQLVSQLAGISLAAVYQPGAADRVSSVTRLFDLLATALFLVVGGHRLVIGALLNTFRDWPPGSFQPSHGTVQLLAQLFGRTVSPWVCKPFCRWSRSCSCRTCWPESWAV